VSTDTTRVAEAEIEASLAALLATYPDAPVAALGATGHLCEIPTGTSLAGRRVLDSESGFDLVAPSSRQTLFDLFVRAKDDGACEARITTSAGHTVTTYLLDLRHRWGVYVLVWVPHGRGMADAPVRLPRPEPLVPRCGRLWRNERAETIRVDDGICAMLGYSEPELLSIRAVDLLHPDDYIVAVHQWLDIVGASPGASRRSRGRRRRADGSWLWLEVTNTNRLDDPDEPHVHSEMIDVSEEVAARAELHRHREVLRRISESVPLGLYLWGVRSPRAEE
jgi:PAS domain S-box-containing protein